MFEIETIKALVAMYLPEDREGQGLVEYALIIALIAIVCIGAPGALGGKVSSTLQKIAGSLV